MRTSRVFQPTNDEIDALARDHPLALVVSSSPQGLLAGEIQGATEGGCEELATMMRGANAQRL